MTMFPAAKPRVSHGVRFGFKSLFFVRKLNIDVCFFYIVKVVEHIQKLKQLPHVIFPRMGPVRRDPRQVDFFCFDSVRA